MACAFKLTSSARGWSTKSVTRILPELAAAYLRVNDIKSLLAVPIALVLCPTPHPTHE